LKTRPCGGFFVLILPKCFSKISVMDLKFNFLDLQKGVEKWFVGSKFNIIYPYIEFYQKLGRQNEP